MVFCLLQCYRLYVSCVNLHDDKLSSENRMSIVSQFCLECMRGRVCYNREQSKALYKHMIGCEKVVMNCVCCNAE